MNRFAKWLQRRATGTEALGYVFLGVVFSLTWSLLMSLVYVGLWGIPVSNRTSDDPKQIVNFLVFVFIFAYLVAFIEELFFRIIFWDIFIKIYSHPHDIVWGLAGNLLIFGFAHYPVHHSIFFSIFVQGIVGAVFSLVYLKTGGQQGKSEYGVFWSTLTHGSCNTILAGVGLVAVLYMLHH